MSALREGLLSLLDRVVAHRVDPRDGLVVNGFWRSGTTWLQAAACQLLDAKPVFEPFQARAGYIFHCLGELGASSHDYSTVAALMPYAETDFDHCLHLRSLIARSLRGTLAHRAVQRDRKRVGQALKPRVVTKFVRASLCLAAIRRTFGVPVVHLNRDPRMVVASIRRRPAWGEGAFTAMPLRSLLLQVEDGRAAAFEPWSHEIDRADRGSPTERLTLYWCLTELVAERVCREHPDIPIVGYERLVRDGVSAFRRVLERAGCRIRSPEAPSDDSVTEASSTSYGRTAAAHEDRLSGWKRELSTKQIAAIEHLVERCGLTHRLVDA